MRLSMIRTQKGMQETSEADSFDGTVSGPVQSEVFSEGCCTRLQHHSRISLKIRPHQSP